MINLNNTQILALGAVEIPDYDVYWRKACRWYSEKFATPLHVVENDILETDVWRHYFESRFWEKKENESLEKWTEFKNSILLDPEEIEDKEVEDDDWAEEELKRIKAEEEGPDLTRTIGGEDS